MDEAAVKAQVLNHIRRASAKRKPILTTELTLGSSGARADIAVLSEAELIGFEIKTARDNLRRLPAQLEAYSCYFDYVVIVAAPCHLTALSKIHLHGASVWRTDEVGLEPLISGEMNSITSQSYLDLMTRQEKKGLEASCNMGVRSHYFNTFTRRYGQTSLTLWDTVAGRKIKPEDVRLLSRFIERRTAFHLEAQKRQERWQRWNDAYAGMSIMACPA
jgi:hypothetical protein